MTLSNPLWTMHRQALPFGFPPAVLPLGRLACALLIRVQCDPEAPVNWRAKLNAYHSNDIATGDAVLDKAREVASIVCAECEVERHDQAGVTILFVPGSGVRPLAIERAPDSAASVFVDGARVTLPVGGDLLTLEEAVGARLIAWLQEARPRSRDANIPRTPAEPPADIPF